jgi:DNA-binding LacI/PurR family transcriptional regulator
MRRPTIADIARECGVSPTAVSFALNGRPGISEARREEILGKAAELGWTPSAAARALATSRVDAIGMVIAAPLSALARDTFYLQLIAGIERSLADSPVALVLKMVESLPEELDVIRAWWAQNRVDAVVLVNPRSEDPRPALVRELGIPAVFLGDLAPEEGVSSVFVDDADATRLLLRDVVALGYRSLAYLHSDVGSMYRHAHQRLEILESSDDLAVRTCSVAAGSRGADTVAAAVSGAVDRLLVDSLPEVLLCEDETIALAALARLSEHDLAVPRDVGLISWEGSVSLEVRRPAVSSLDRDPMLLGEAAVEVLRESREGGEPVRREIDPPRLILRDSLSRRPQTREPGTPAGEQTRSEGAAGQESRVAEAP